MFDQFKERQWILIGYMTGIYGYESKYKVWIKAPNPHTIHTPRSIPWSIPCGTAWSIPLIHTPDPYPFLIEERLMLALLLLLLLLPLLVIFLPGAAAAAAAVASAAAPAGPALAAGAGSLPPCASGSWTNATSWVATSNIASAAHLGG